MPRALLIYALILPLAVLLGYMLATPTDFNSFAFVLMSFTAISIPAILKWHHFLLACTWNAALIVFFLPGQPQLGVVLAFLSLGVSMVTRTLSKHKQFIRVPALTMPLLCILAIVLVTAKFTGGFGGRVFGAETWGSKRYLGVFGAIAGYFAFSAMAVPKEKARLYLTVFLLGGLTALISDLTYMAGPQFYFLYVLFPSDYAAMQALTADVLMRFSGVSYASAWTYYFLMGRFGIEGLFDFHAPWRLLYLAAAVVGSLFGGYRGLVILMALIFMVQFFVEGVYRRRLGPVLIFASLMTLVGMLSVVDKMPLSIQRAFSFLPIEGIDPTARQDALGTLDWRLSMWKLLLPEVPKYLILGKGYGFNGTDYYLTQEAIRRGMYANYEDTLISGNYHNGILTLLIPFGIFGFSAFLWFCGSSWWVLWRNSRFGDPDLRVINNFLLTYFCARLLFYFVFYGQFDIDFFQFTGTVGMSVAINGGVRSPESLVEPDLVEEENLVLA